MGLSVFVYKMEIIISHRWSWGLLSAQEVAAWEHGRCRCHSLGISLSGIYTGWETLVSNENCTTSCAAPSSLPGSHCGIGQLILIPLLICKVPMIDIWQRVEIFNLKSWPVFIPGSNLNAISVSLSQPVSSLQRSPGFISACSPHPWTRSETESAFLPQSAGGSYFFLTWIRNLMIFWKICHDVWVCSLII